MRVDLARQTSKHWLSRKQHTMDTCAAVTYLLMKRLLGYLEAPRGNHAQQDVCTEKCVYVFTYLLFAPLSSLCGRNNANLTKVLLTLIF